MNITQKQAHILDIAIIAGVFAIGGFIPGIVCASVYTIAVTVFYGSRVPVVQPKA